MQSTTLPVYTETMRQGSLIVPPRYAAEVADTQRLLNRNHREHYDTYPVLMKLEARLSIYVPAHLLLRPNKPAILTYQDQQVAAIVARLQLCINASRAE